MPRLIDKKYLPVTVLKSDPKGKVMKCLDVSRPLKIRWVLLKEGKHDACMDEAGRDIRDRLRWQYKVQQEIAKEKLAPAPYSIFDWNNDTYIAMEFIEGVSLHELLGSIYCGRPLFLVPEKGRERIIELFLQVLRVVEKLHAKGYIHRDLTPHNFLLENNNKLLFIDLELAYSVTHQKPLPPFTLGSPGYMSPQQASVNTPSIAEDIYGLGAMMIRFFTGLPPVKFDRKDMSRLYNSLEFFTGNKTLGGTITQCLDNNHKSRPGLREIQNALDRLSVFTEPDGGHTPCECLIEKSLKALESPRFAGETGNRRLEDEIGIKYLFAVAGRQGVAGYTGMQRKLPAGLFQGTWGLAFAIAIALKAGLLPDNGANRSFIKECLSVAGRGLGMADGVAGQGVAILHCRAFLDEMYADELLGRIVATLLKQHKHLHAPGLFYGKAGVAWFLLAYCEKYTNKKAFVAAEEILQGLSQQKTVRKLSPWLGEGFTGLAFVHIKAFEVSNDKKYKEQAERLLKLHPPKILSGTFGATDGLAGVGEVYLETYRVLGGTEWKERADWIAGVFAKTYYQQQDGGVYWLTGHSLTPTADLTTGNAGIIHFLLRYHNNNIPFPLFNNSL